MSTLHCPLCGLRFRYSSEYDVHVREDHAPPAQLHRPPPKPRTERDEEETAPVPPPDHEPVLHLPW